ncbi:endolytic transglycosylase MltG [Balneatrix alpica]|uniref:Endolytic murein transglycosylase n=1 Tax=Balneatrix alpica TaxID=75684 RepID=A0ABV5Z768_9GAMM|nr:endolytic transglycosylase MltG [Balneatrix alpica]
MLILWVMRLLLLALLLLISGAYAWQWALNQLNAPMPLTSEEEVYWLKPGDGLYQVADELKQRGWFAYPELLVWHKRLLQPGGTIKTGEYAVRKGTSALELVEMLHKGKVLEYRVTLVEGFTFKQFLQTLHAEPKLKKTLAGVSDGAIMERIGATGEHPEGRFFPDTYTYHASMTDLDILKQSYQRMQQTLEQAWAGRQPNLPYKNAYEALIMASIIEKETGVASEREQIAGVFVRRLQKGMRLQTDPTVIYGLGERFKGNLTRQHLREPTPYNTYTINGLPPTPIAMPGKASLYAAVNPAEGKALYFVASGDGGHVFSNNLNEHNNAVQRYLRKLRENKAEASDEEQQ